MEKVSITVFKNKYGNTFESKLEAEKDERKIELQQAVSNFVDNHFHYSMDKQDCINMILEWDRQSSAKKRKATNNVNILSDGSRTLKKIPLIISYYDDNGANGWRAEIPDNYENYKPRVYDKLDFEDISFHFEIPSDFETHEIDQYVFTKREFAVEAAKYVNEKFLNNKGKLWFL